MSCLTVKVVMVGLVAFLPALVFGADNTTSTAGISDLMGCSSAASKFNPLIHKSKYRVGVHAIRGFQNALLEYNLTFSKYLTATAGRKFDPPIEFEMIPTTFNGLFDAAEAEEVDFFYANPGIYSCIGVEHGAQPLATIVSHLEVRGHIYDLDVFGGVMFTQAENDEINNIHDLKDKIIAAGGISMIMAAQLQFYHMEVAGMSYVMDPKQVVFTGNQVDVVQGVLDRKFDVGFVRTDQIERHVLPNGDQLDPDVFKVIEPKIYVLDDGNLFPFLHSTDIYPEWPVAALDHVTKDVSEAVQESLLALGDHAIASETNEYTRCETTPQLAQLALAASRAGKLAGFRTPRSYFEVRTMHEAAGFIKKDERGHWKCTRAETLYDGVECPAGHYKLTEERFEASCGNQGLPCDEGYECFCRPCVEAFEVDVFQYDETNLDANTEYRGCDKMSLCGSVEQTKEITFRVVDNQQREGAEIEVIIHLGQETLDVPVYKVENSPYMYEFHWSEHLRGVAIMEISVDGDQIPESPVRVEVIERDCATDFPGQGKVSSRDGDCVCGGNTVGIGGKCIQSSAIALSASVAAFVILVIIGYFIVQQKRRKSDEMWTVSVDELHFDDPVEVIGQGSFGVVLRAEYRGTKVAIKRAFKTTTGGTTRTGSRRDGSGMMVGGVTGSVEDVSRGSNEIFSDDDTHDTYDIETGGRDRTHSKDSILMEGTSRRDDDFCLDFLNDGYRRQNKWAKVFPWLARDNYQSRFQESILGGSGTMPRKSVAAMVCPCFNANARKQQEFVNEMRVLSRLRHPCITTMMGAVIAHTRGPMLVMEYMEYGSLHDLLRNETFFFSGEIIMQIARDVAQGLRYLHSSKPAILHGDLKGRNILIDSRFRAKLCDFGLSTKQAKGISGTPFWLAPEYLRGETQYNATCDMYSVGIILYEIYSRKNPYEGEDFRDVMRKVCNRRLNRRPDLPATAPLKIADLMKKCWSPDPNYRPQAKELDMLLMDMNPQDFEPLTFEQQAGMSKKPTKDMLYEIFPRHIADALKKGEKVEPENHELVTVVFSDIVHFTDISREITPMKVSSMLDRLYLAFDRIANKHRVFKVETIGDAYMGVTNLEANQVESHVKRIAEFAVDMINEAGKILVDDEEPSKGYINIRVGFHSGPVVSNVTGSLNPRYGLFGDTVNTASRMESNSSANRVLCSETAYKLLKQQSPKMPVKKRGKIAVKGKGDMNVYWVGDGLVSSEQHNAASECLAEKHVELTDNTREDATPSLLDS